MYIVQYKVQYLWSPYIFIKVLATNSDFLIPVYLQPNILISQNFIARYYLISIRTM